MAKKAKHDELKLQEEYPLEYVKLSGNVPDSVKEQFNACVRDGKAIDYLNDLLAIYGDDVLAHNEISYLQKYLDNKKFREVSASCRFNIWSCLGSYISNLLRRQHEHEMIWKCEEGFLSWTAFPLEYISVPGLGHCSLSALSGLTVGDVKNNPEILYGKSNHVDNIGYVRANKIIDRLNNLFGFEIKRLEMYLQ